MDMAEGRWESIWMTKLFEHQTPFSPSVDSACVDGRRESWNGSLNQVTSWRERWNAPSRAWWGGFCHPDMSELLQPEAFLSAYLDDHLCGDSRRWNTEKNKKKKQDNPFLPVAWLLLRDAHVDVCADCVVAQSLVGGTNH